MQVNDTEEIPAAPQMSETFQAALEGNPAANNAPSLEETLREAELKAAEFHDSWLRAKAETENVRRRAQEDIAKAAKFAIDRFARCPLYTSRCV